MNMTIVLVNDRFFVYVAGSNVKVWSRETLKWNLRRQLGLDRDSVASIMIALDCFGKFEFDVEETFKKAA